MNSELRIGCVWIQSVRRILAGRLLILAVGVALLAGPALAATNYWTGVGDSNWFNTNNWSLTNLPGAGDEVVITNAGNKVLLTGSPPYLLSFSISNQTLVFSNWDTCLSATNVTIWNKGTITVANAFTTDQMSNRVHVDCSNFMLATGGAINVDMLGYQYHYGPGAGGGAGQPYAGGGGYGGRGGNGSGGYNGGALYGLTNAPLAPGSGGTHWADIEHGGGAVWIEVGNSASVHGVISANGGNALNAGGGGSGGAIYIQCGAFSGSTSGMLRVNGGTGGTGTGGRQGGGGAGGRIAVVYNSVTAQPAVQFYAMGGVGYSGGGVGGDERQRQANLGTIYFSDTNLLADSLTQIQGYLVISNATEWAPGGLVVSNAIVGFAENFTLNVCGSMRIEAGSVRMGPFTRLDCSNDLLLTNGGSLYVYSGATNSPGEWASNGALVSVGGQVRIASNSWIYPQAHETNGGAPLFRMGNLTIDPYGGIMADQRGYLWDTGPGKGLSAPYGGGGGHGGRGGNGSNGGNGGDPYGSTNAPLAPGSGGSYWFENVQGGGAVWIEVDNSTRIDGIISANGGDASNAGGGGSGGSIFIQSHIFNGSTSGVLRANGGTGGGGSGTGGGGGGGRIAVWEGISRSMRDRYLASELNARAVVKTTDGSAIFAGTVSVTRGIGYNPTSANAAYPGTCFFFKYGKGTVFSAGGH